MLYYLQMRQAKTHATGIATAALLAVSSMCCTSPRAQQQGPLPTSAGFQRASASGQARRGRFDSGTGEQHPRGANSTISNQPPALPVDQIIQRFACSRARGGVQGGARQLYLHPDLRNPNN